MSIDAMRSSTVFPSACRSGQELQPQADVEDRSAFCRRTCRREVVAALVWLGKLASAFRDVEHDRSRGARKLIGEMTATTREVFDRVVGEDKKVEGQLVHVKALVISGRKRERERERERERAKGCSLS